MDNMREHEKGYREEDEEGPHGRHGEDKLSGASLYMSEIRQFRTGGS